MNQSANPMNKNRIARLRSRLVEALAPAQIEIVDDGHLHVGHPGARQGGHYTVTIIAEAFTGKSLLERHRMVYAALGELMSTDIHALSIKASTPHETTAVS